MNWPSDTAFVAFDGEQRIAAGDLRDVARAAKRALDQNKEAAVLIFDGVSSNVVDLDFRGTVDDVLARLPAADKIAQEEIALEEPTPPANRSPGRPKLGVVAREITLLPRHWEWLARQSGGASVAIRKLVDEARRGGEEKRSHPPGTGRRLSLHVGNGRQQAAFRRGGPRPVRTGSLTVQEVDRRLARRRARACRTARGTGIPAQATGITPVDPKTVAR